MGETDDLLRTTLPRAPCTADLDSVEAPPNYRLVRPIGRGGFGAVYLAEDLTLERQVAIKFLTSCSASELERFRREAKYAARLSDPAIVRIYELGEADGRPYIAMQYVDGGSLDDALLSPEALVRAARRVAGALAHAHAEGIVHRDIKPQNILLDRDGRAYVTDFGLARDLRGREGLSIDGVIMGTPALMPPEQARGDVRAIDGRSDVYSLGATLYAKLAGRPPFLAGNVVDVLHEVLHREPCLIRSIHPDLPRSLEAIVMRCLRKNAAERYQTMADLALDLDRFLESQPISQERTLWFRRLVGASVPDRPAEGPDSRVALVMDLAREIAAWDVNLYRITSTMSRADAELESLVRRLDELQERFPGFALARFYRGAVLFRRGQLDLALEEMERSIGGVGELAGAHFDLGRLYVAIYLRELREAHEHVAPEGRDEQIQGSRNWLSKAVASFREAQRLRGELPMWQLDFTRAIERLADGDAEGCVAICDAILATDEDIEEIWKLRGDALGLGGQDPAPSYRRALTIRRCYTAAAVALAEHEHAQGRSEQALVELDRALHMDPEFLEARTLRGQILLCRHMAGDEASLALALEDAEGARSSAPGSYHATVLWAAVAIARGRRDRDMGMVTRAIEALEALPPDVGCPRRVKLTRAQALLERALLARERGESPLRDLAALGEIRSAIPEGAGRSDDWREVWEQADALRGACL